MNFARNFILQLHARSYDNTSSKFPDKQAPRPKLARREARASPLVIIGRPFIDLPCPGFRYIVLRVCQRARVSGACGERSCFNEIVKFDQLRPYLSAYQLHATVPWRALPGGVARGGRGMALFG